jgi:anti-sigma factor RsiW
MSSEGLDRELAAWRDGELPWLRRLRVERRLRRDPDARRRLEALETAALLLSEVDAEGPEPDLWESVRRRLPALDAQRAEAAAAASARRGPRRTLGWSAIGAVAVAAATVALLLRLGDAALAPAPVPHGSVRWLDARGLPMMVLRDDAEATIIWVPERQPAKSSGRLEARDGFV